MATFSINLLNTNFIDFALDSKGSSYVNSYQRYLPRCNYGLDATTYLDATIGLDATTYLDATIGFLWSFRDL